MLEELKSHKSPFPCENTEAGCIVKGCDFLCAVVKLKPYIPSCIQKVLPNRMCQQAKKILLLNLFVRKSLDSSGSNQLKQTPVETNGHQLNTVKQADTT